MVVTKDIRDGDIQLSTNIYLREMRSKDGDPIVKYDPSLIALLQTLRDMFRSPIRIHSGYRSPEHNAAVGGSPTSKHLQGMAADISIDGVPVAVIAYVVDRLFPSSMGIEVAEDGSYVHLSTQLERWRAWTPHGGSAYTTVDQLFPHQ